MIDNQIVSPDVRPLALPESTVPALLGDDGSQLTYSELRRRVAAEQKKLHFPHLPDKCLLALFGDRELGSVLVYLAALQCGHAVAWLNPRVSEGTFSGFLSRYHPEIVVVANGRQWSKTLADSKYNEVSTLAGGVSLAVTSEATREEIHPAINLLLSTSGVTGSSKMVRISTESAIANTNAIITSLDITPMSRSATSLPLHYTYGLSILNTHLAAGASILLTAKAPTGRAFWKSFDKLNCDSFATVPYGFEVLSRASIDPMRAVSLKKMMVSGGRLSDGIVRKFADPLLDRGGGFYMMYGQTEATARITVLNPHDYPGRAGSVGRPIGDGTIWIEDDNGHKLATGETGNVIYSGISVMHGYAHDRASLSHGDEMRQVLRTGDVGWVDADGFLYLSGRVARFIKPNGYRLDLNELEQRLGDLRPVAAVPEGSDRAVVFAEKADYRRVESAAAVLLRELALPSDAIRVVDVHRLPRTLRKKIDYQRLSMWEGRD